MAQQGRVLVNEAEDLSWSPKTHRIEQRTDFAKLSSGVHIHCVEQAFVCLYACTHNKHMNAEIEHTYCYVWQQGVKKEEKENKE